MSKVILVQPKERVGYPWRTCDFGDLDFGDLDFGDFDFGNFGAKSPKSQDFGDFGMTI
jgi:hypothetical protein